MKVIEITVDVKGTTTVTVRGFVGGACRDATRFVEDALGRRTAETLTPEFYHQGNEAHGEQRQSQ